MCFAAPLISQPLGASGGKRKKKFVEQPCDLRLAEVLVVGGLYPIMSSTSCHVRYEENSRHPRRALTPDGHGFTRRFAGCVECVQMPFSPAND